MTDLAGFLDEIDLEPLVRQSAREAAGLLTSGLAVAGTRYPWSRLAPWWTRVLFERMRDLADPTPEDLRMVAAAAHRAARDWVPLHELEFACETVVTCAIRRLWDVIEARMCGQLLAIASWASGARRVVLAALRHAYVDETNRLGGARRAGELVIGTLLDGGDVASVASVVGAALPEPCGLIVLAPVREPGASADWFPFDRLPPTPESMLLNVTSGLYAATHGGERLVALVHVPSLEHHVAAPVVRAAAERLTSACESAYGRRFAAGLALAKDMGAARDAVDEAIEVVDLLVRSGRPQPTAFLEEVVLELLLDHRPDLARRLEAWAAGLWEHPELWETVRSLYCGGLDRGRTARRLGIHRSTLDHRLGRVERFTTVPPTSARGIVLLTAALAARGLSMTHSGDRPEAMPQAAG